MRAKQGNGKRNAIQRSIDKKAALEMLLSGKTYEQVSRYISQTRPYTISRQQIQSDIEEIRLEAIAQTLVHAIA